jgi:membrane protein
MGSGSKPPAPADEPDRPWRLPGRRWAAAVRRIARSLRCDQIWLTAAGVAFCALVAAIPAAAVAVALYGLVGDPNAVRPPIQRLSGILPVQASGFLADHLRAVASASKLQLGAGLGGAILVALWAAQGGAVALIASLNLAYGEQERRSFAYRQAVALTVAVFAALFSFLALVLFSALAAEPRPGAGASLAGLTRWPALALTMAAALVILYRYAPSRRAPKWRWVVTGAVAAAVLWLAGGLAFSNYVTASGAYTKVFGPLGVLLMLMTWFYWTALVVLLGAELNAALERQTARDTTEGPDLPEGGRGAAAADQVETDRPS